MAFFQKCDRYKKTFKYFANYSRLKQDERSIQRLRIFQTIVWNGLVQYKQIQILKICA